MCVAVPLKVISVSQGWADLEIGGGSIKARTDLVPVEPGDYVLLHAGFIIQKLKKEEALKTLKMFDELEEALKEPSEEEEPAH